MRTVFFDIDTQNDFMLPAGALYVPGAERILPLVAHLNRYAAEHSIPLISTMDAHAERDPEFQHWPAHCVAGTIGQQKPAETLLEKRVAVPTSPGGHSIEGAQQILLETQTLDCFDNANLPGLLEMLGAERYVVYGVVTEYCVKCAALGLLKTVKQVDLVTDAIRSLKDEEAAQFLAQFQAAGGRLVTSDRI